jgi:hypothetical protein
MMATAIALLTMADSSFLILTAGKGYSTGNPIDLGWICCFLLIGLAALYPVQIREETTAELRIASIARENLPYMALAAAVLTAAITWLVRGTIGTVPFFNGIAILILVSARQVTSIYERRALAQRLANIATQIATGSNFLIAAEELRTALATHMSTVESGGPAPPDLSRDLRHSAERLERATQELGQVTGTQAAALTPLLRELYT